MHYNNSPAKQVNSKDGLIDYKKDSFLIITAKRHHQAQAIAIM